MTIENFQWAQLLALFIGPSIGIFTVRYVDFLAEKRKRKVEVFKGLFLTRGLEDTEEHLKSFNMVPVEFSEQKKVIKAWESLMGHYDKPEWDNPDSVQALGLQANDLRGDLLDELAKEIKIDLPEKASHKKGYIPKWIGNMQKINLLNQNNILALNQMLYGTTEEDFKKPRSFKIEILS